MKDPLETMMDVLTGRGYYHVTLSDGEVRHLSWHELHVDFKELEPRAYAAAKWRWVSDTP